MDLQDIGWDGIDWIHSAQNKDWQLALLKMVVNFYVP
jgi:hypothetical protein